MDDRERKMKELELLKLKEQEWQWQQSQQQPAPAQPESSGGITGAIMNAGRAVANAPRQAGEAIAEAWRGQHDPQMRGVRTFEEKDAWQDGMTGDLGMAVAKMTGTSDKTYANQVKSLLEQKGYRVELFEDANGYPMVSYTDGNIAKTRRLNEPGMDWGDVDRGVMQTLPYMAAAPVRAAGGIVSRMGKFAGREAGTAAVMDEIGSQFDSGIDPGDRLNNAFFAGAMGAMGELIGSAAIPFKNKMVERKIYKKGLTPEGEALLRERGIDPADLDEVGRLQFAKDTARGQDADMAARAALLDTTGAPMTRSRVTLDPEDIRIEQDIASGSYGREAQDRLASEAGPRAQQQFARQRADRLIYEKAGVDREATESAGQTIQESGRAMKSAEKAVEEGSWETVKPDSLRFKAPAGLRKQIPDKVADEIDGLMGKKMNSREAYTMLDDWMNGRLQTKPITSNAKGETVPSKNPSVIDIRNTLNQYGNLAKKDSAEYSRIATLRDALDDYVEVLASKGIMKDRTLQEYMVSKDLSRKFRDKWQKKGGYDPGGDWVQKFFDGDREFTPDNIVRDIFGTGFNPNQASLARAKRVKDIFGAKSPETDLLRASMIAKATENNSGNLLPPQTIINNLRRMQKNSAAKEFIDERGNMAVEKYIRELEISKSPDPLEGRAQQTQDLMRKNRDSFLRYWLSAKGSGARFTNRPAEALGWHFLARNLKVNPLGSRQWMADKVVEGQLLRKNMIPKRPRSGLGGKLGGATSTQIGGDDDASSRSR